MGGLTIGILNYDAETFGSNRKRHQCRHLFSQRLSWLGWPPSIKVRVPIPSCGNFQVCMPCENVEVGIVMEDGRIGANSDGTNETIDQLANGFPFPATDAI